MPSLQKGLAKKIIVPIVLLVVAVVVYFAFTTDDITSIVQMGNDQSESFNGNGIRWQFDMEKGDWEVSSTPPDCQKSLTFPAPVDVRLASGILYPGQLRGGDYKPHGGFRFDNRTTNDVEVRTIMDGYVLKASKYDNDGETQILIFFVNDCGIMVMHDHLLTLSPKLQEILKHVPVGKDGDSRTTDIKQRVYFKKGELLASEIGYREYVGGYKGKNIFVDFGLYDLRKVNNVKYDAAFRSNHPNINEYGTHALCWFDNLSPKDEKIVRSLPVGGREGKTSDYCR